MKDGASEKSQENARIHDARHQQNESPF